MRLAIMQPYIFPYIGYFQLIDSVDKFISYTHVDYIKRGWMNRNRFMIINNQISYFSIPTLETPFSTKIHSVKIDYSFNWKTKLRKDLIHNYKRSPFFEEVRPVIKEILKPDFLLLHELNFHSLEEICRFLDIQTTLIPKRTYFEELEEQLRNQKSKEKRMEKRIIDICKTEGATTYVNAIGGKTLYKSQPFTQNSINLKFIKTLDYTYQQNSQLFQPNLSIIDVLMNCGRDGTKKILNQYKLID